MQDRHPRHTDATLNTTQDAAFEAIAANAAADGIMVQSLDGRILWCNPAFCALHGRPREELIGRNPLSFDPPDGHPLTGAELCRFRLDPCDPRHATARLQRTRRPDGVEFWNQMTVRFQTAPDGVVHAVTVCRDVTVQTDRDRALSEARRSLEHAATHDALTGIANLAAFLHGLRAALAATGPAGPQVGVLRLDIDRFKQINDTHGHAAGDAVLVRVAEVLRAHVRRTDLVARVGGDEFAVLCPGVHRLTDIEAIARTLCDAIARPFDWENRSLRVTASIGAALSQPGTTEVEPLMQQSDFALYEVKRTGRHNSAVFDADLHRRHARHQSNLDAFALALREGHVRFAFQPVMSTLTGTLAGIEALARWDHPTEGAVPPERFLPLAAELGLMPDLDLAAFRAAVAMKHRLASAGFPEVRAGFNASLPALSDEGYVAALLEAVAASGFPPEHFVVEVLESVFLTPRIAGPVPTLERLSRAGLEVLLDDFGNGHAGLAQLAHLPLNGVKIDQSLIRDVMTDPKIALIVSTLIGLCQNLGLNVVVEGVEDLDLARRLTRFGSRFIQGFWLGHPMPPEEVLTLYRTHDPAGALTRLGAAD